MKRVRLSTVVRDLLPLAIGAFGIIHQEITRSVNIELLVAYMALLGVPAATNVFSLLKWEHEGSVEEKQRQLVEDLEEKDNEDGRPPPPRHSSTTGR